MSKSVSSTSSHIPRRR